MEAKLAAPFGEIITDRPSNQQTDRSGHRKVLLLTLYLGSVGNISLAQSSEVLFALFGCSGASPSNRQVALGGRSKSKKRCSFGWHIPQIQPSYRQAWPLITLDRAEHALKVLLWFAFFESFWIEKLYFCQKFVVAPPLSPRVCGMCHQKPNSGMFRRPRNHIIPLRKYEV